MKNFRIRLILAFVLITIFIIYLNFVQINSYNFEVDNNKNKVIEKYEDERNSNIKLYNINTRTFFNEVINNDYLLGIVKKANTATIEENVKLREQLYNLINNSFKEQHINGYRHLHIYLNNSIVFLNTNKIEKYDIDVSEYREIVRQTSIYGKYNEDYEICNSRCEYRILYPLFYNNEQIGAVEMAIDIFELAKSETNINYIIKKDAFTDKEEALNNYVISDISDNYYYSKQVLELNELNLNVKEKDTIFEINNKITKNYQNQINNEQDFVATINNGSYNYLVLFQSISNIENEHIGYYIIYHDNKGFIVNRNYLILKLLITNLLWILILLAVIYVNNHKKKLVALTRRDALTKCYNRYAFNGIYKKEYQRYLRYKSSFSLVMVDIDHFKLINDKYGHSIGDKVLIKIADLLKTNIRSIDSLVRWGGEEFIIVLPETDDIGALKSSEKLRKVLENYDFQIKNVKKITASFGIAVYSENDNIDTLVNRADKKMYKAKVKGRNRVEK